MSQLQRLDGEDYTRPPETHQGASREASELRMCEHIENCKEMLRGALL